MDLAGKVVVVTGGAMGIGRALCERFARAGAKVAVVDLEAELAREVAATIGGIGLAADVSNEADIQRVAAETERQLGPIDVFCSNAGVAFSDAPDWTAADVPTDKWMTCWNVNVMAHVYAARAVIPGMIARGGGYLVNVASAAGLLNQIGDAAYSTTKHAAIGFAEALAITHGDDNIKVSVLCPQAVATRMIGMDENGFAGNAADGVLSPAEVADAVLEGMREEKFLILPHPQALDYYQGKAQNYDRWLGGMRKLRRSVVAQSPEMQYKY